MNAILGNGRYNEIDKGWWIYYINRFEYDDSKAELGENEHCNIV